MTIATVRRGARSPWALGLAVVTLVVLASARDASDAAPSVHSGRPVEMDAPRLLAGVAVEPGGAVPGGDVVEVDVRRARAMVDALGPAPAPAHGLAGREDRLRRVDQFEARTTHGVVRLARVPMAGLALADPDTVEAVVGTRTFTVPIEVDDYPDHVGQRYCDPRPKPGTVLLAALLVEAHPTSGSMGISRPCEVGRVSEHKEGRGFDWDVTSLDPEVVDAALERLLAPDRQGNEHALARRIGIMYMIWNNQIWSSRLPDQGWRAYTGPHGHRDHVHFSLSWAGALGHTTLWQAAADEGWLTPMPPVDRVLAGLTPWTPPAEPTATATPSPTPSPAPSPTQSPTPSPAATPSPGTTTPRPPTDPDPSPGPTTRPSPPTSPTPTPTPPPTTGPTTPAPSPSGTPPSTTSPSPSPSPTDEPPAEPTAESTPDSPPPTPDPSPDP